VLKGQQERNTKERRRTGVLPSGSVHGGSVGGEINYIEDV